MRIRKLRLLLIAFIVLGATGLYVVYRPSQTFRNLYDREYFEGMQQASVSSASRVVPELVKLFSPRSVVDVGCGLGAWLAEFQNQGVTDVMGIDGDWVDRKMLSIPPRLFTAHDLRKPLSLGRRFDLALSLEVAEHLPAERAEGFVADLVLLAPVVLFSAAIPHQGGTDHINEQWPDYWAARFRKFGYVPLDCLRFRFWDDDRVECWYRQNMILYARRDYVEEHPQLKSILDEQPPTVRRLVHPGVYALVVEGREPSLRGVLGLLPGAATRAIKRRFDWLIGKQP